MLLLLVFSNDDRTVPYRIPTTIINNVLINEKRTEQQNLISNL